MPAKPQLPPGPRPPQPPVPPPHLTGDAGPLTPERATAEALAALKAAGFGKENGKPFKVRSRHYGRVPLHTGPECVLTEVEVRKAAHLDDAAARALLCLRGGVLYGERGRVALVYREAGTPGPQGEANEGEAR